MGPYRVPRRDLFEYAVTYYAGCVIFLYKGLFKNQNNILLETLPEAGKQTSNRLKYIGERRGESSVLNQQLYYLFVLKGEILLES